MDHPEQSTGSGTYGPPAVHFRPNEEGLPPPLDRPPEDDGTAILLVASEGSDDWGADAAVAIATEWAGGGRRVVLLDLHLESPVLHDRAGVENLEGAVDIFLYGASLARSARLIEDGGFYLISAGTFTSDPGAICRSARWQKLVDGFREANAVLLVFAPGDADRAALETWIPHTVVIGQGPTGTGRPPYVKLLRDRPTSAVAAPAVGAEGIAVDHAAAPPDEPSRAVEPDLPPPAGVSARRRRKTGRQVPLLLWILLAIVILAGAAATLWYLRPDLFPLPGQEGAEATAGAAAYGEEGPESVPFQGELMAVPLPVSVQVRTYSSLRSANDDVDQASRRDRETDFFVAPEVVEGALYYKVFAGAFADTAAAAVVRDRLVERGIADAEEALGGWSLVRSVPFAFDLGQFSSRAEAGRRADALLEHGVPAYAVPLTYTDGGQRWQLYGGAYPGEEQAAGMQRLLDEARVTASLVERVGTQSEA